MGYVPGLAENERLHRRHHDEIVNGVLGGPLKSDNVIWTCAGARITVVTPLSQKAQRVRARKVAQAANREVCYEFGIYSEFEPLDERNLHVFLYHENDRIVGLALLELRTHIWRSTWSSREKQDTEMLMGHPPVWSLGFAWVHRRCRRRGIATRLFAAATRHLHVKAAEVGVYTPFTESGQALARALFPDTFLIAK